MRGSGGTQGGVGTFTVGLILAALGTYLFFDSVKVITAPAGLLSGMMGGRRGGMMETTSMGILFVPLFIGVIALFYDARKRWAWGLTALGLVVLAIEIFSRIHFLMTAKTTHFLGMIVLFCAGVGLMLRSYLDFRRAEKDNKKQP